MYATSSHLSRFVSLLSICWLSATLKAASANPASLPRSGIYPHLAMFNDENECGTGGVVPWADRLWVITYAPHRPNGSTDKLYEIDHDLTQSVRHESVGGTPANRFFHRESEQLFLGPYVIDRNRQVRVIPPGRMPGRLTGNARHLNQPADKIYYATMEEGFYEVDVRSLAVRELFPDANGQASHAGTLLPGYHGKGLYSGQGRLVYANNGELSPEAQRRPDIESGCLAEWDGVQWRVVRRNQFTEVTGPGGLYGNAQPSTDPVWSIGWDHRSLILMLLDQGKWHAYRLPKSSHSYDGAHGWNTEWPRIRDVGEKSLLMTMHGAFWRFPKTFSQQHSAGIEPRSNYLKVIGDFCRWQDWMVFGCDDSARSEFLNVRKAKGKLAPPGRSQSNLWFARPFELDELGPVIGRGAVWMQDDLRPGEASDPFLFSGYDLRSLHITHRSSAAVVFQAEIDAKGNGEWKPFRRMEVPAQGDLFAEFRPGERGAWIRLIPDRPASKVTAVFAYRNKDRRSSSASALFGALARPGDSASQITGGLLHAGGGDKPVLRFFARSDGQDIGLYALDESLTLRPVDSAETVSWMKTNASIPAGVLTADRASVVYRDARGTWRLPRGDESFDREIGADRERVCREVCTERDLFNAHGTFYELPAENAGGFAKIRPVATHNRHIQDYASYRGLLVMSGLRADSSARDPHVVRSSDGKCALWVGNVEDLWTLGKPRGKGGPWNDSPVEANSPSDPYLMTGFDRKSLRLAHDCHHAVTFALEVDITGEGCWVLQERLTVPPGSEVERRLPDCLSAYWARLTSDAACRATATFSYE
jgi:hypothetical protein